MGILQGVLLSSLLVLQLAGAAKILIFPFYHYSHVNLFSVAGKALKDSNHEVTVLVNASFAKTPKKFGLNTLEYHIPPGAAFSDHITEYSKTKNPGVGVLLKTLINVLPTFGHNCDLLLNDQKLMSTIKNHGFDLVIHDGVPCGNCYYTIPYKYNIPYISLNAALDPWSAGVTGLPSLEPVQTGHNTNQMSFIQRLKTFGFYTFLYTLPELTLSGRYYTEKYVPEKPSVSVHRLYRMSELFLVNHDITCLDYPRVSAPNYIFIGGSSARPPSPLDDELRTFVEGAEHGLVVLTFGSLKAWQNLWIVFKPKLIHLANNLPQRFAVLYGLDDTSDLPANVKAMKWLPQNDLLAHPKTKLFMTHGGNNGQLEAVYHGVPHVVVAIVGDQVYNGLRAEHRGYGRVLPEGIDTPQEELLETVLEVLTNESYKENIMKCSAIIKSQPSTQEKIVHWVEHILKFGGDHLRPVSVNLSLFQILMWDIMLFLLVVTVLLVFCCSYCCRCFYRRCCRSKSKAKND